MLQTSETNKHIKDEKEGPRNALAYKQKLAQLGHPLQVFEKTSFFQPYVPLQQMDQLTTNTTSCFLAGTSNAIFTTHRQCATDVVAHVATGQLEIINSNINSIINLSTPDKKFIDDIVVMVENSWEDGDHENAGSFGFSGSDDDIRAKFEHYVTQLLVTTEYCNDLETVNTNSINSMRF